VELVPASVKLRPGMGNLAVRRASAFGWSMAARAVVSRSLSVWAAWSWACRARFKRGAGGGGSPPCAASWRFTS